MTEKNESILRSIFRQSIGRAYDIFRTNITSLKIKISTISGPCLVLGSAPDPVIPDGFDKTWVLMSVNASQASFVNKDMQSHIAVMSDQMFGNEPANIAGKNAIRNSKTGRLFLIKRGRSVSETKRILHEVKYQYKELTIINHWERSRIAYKVLGEYVAIGSGEQKISTGIFAALMACFLGANPVVLSGFSFSANGHAYNTFKHKRSHISADKTALLLARNKRLPFYAADSKFSSESSLPKWKNNICSIKFK